MKETLLVKHAVGGRSFIDTGKSPLDYEVEKTAADGWVFRISTAMNPAVEQILEWKRELNVFLFQEFADQPTKKIWFYVSDGPVTYDAQAGVLTIEAKSRIEYVPDEYGFIL